MFIMLDYGLVAGGNKMGQGRTTHATLSSSEEKWGINVMNEINNILNYLHMRGWDGKVFSRCLEAERIRECTC